MKTKEGDELGIEAIRERLETDEKLMAKAFTLYGVPKILLRNAVPVSKAKEYVDDYEITPSYYFKYDRKKNKVKVIEKPWVIKDDKGIDSYSLLPPAIAVSMIRQIADIISL